MVRIFFDFEKSWRSCWLLLPLLILLCMLSQPACGAIDRLRVVCDDNYPPYIFRNQNGTLTGILVDQWHLWERQTGIKVDLHACTWSEAMQRMQAGEFDVIDTLFYSDARAQVYDFLKPYAAIDVPLFFHNDISGIRTAKDAVGFAVGAKTGDNVINILKDAGVNSIEEFPNYSQLIEAAAAGKIKVFSVDRPPAYYYLARLGVANQFKESKPLYRGEFHRAVLKGQSELAAIVQRGFDEIPAAELEAIDIAWLGRPVESRLQHFWAIIFYILLVAVIVILLLALWLRMLRNMVQARTAELVTTNDSLTREISERKKAEEEKGLLQNQLQHAMKMEAVGRLAGGVAHDFNNLLTAIIGNASLVSLDADPGKIGEHVREIEKAARSAAVLTQQLLAFSRRQNIEPRVININTVILGLDRMLSRMAGDHVQIQLNLVSDLSNVMLDPGQFESILINLVINARDAMQNGGKISLSTANQILEPADCERRPEARPGKYVRLRVSDTGHGMSSDVREHLFEPFFTTKPRGRGTGLGLSAIYGIISQAGGFIEVETEIDQGTAFEIFIPITDREPVAEIVETHEAMPGGNETVLLVEDEDIVRFISAEILKKLGYNLLQACSGAEAIALMGEFSGRIDLLLTDLMMPGMTGRELAGKIAEIRPETKILYTSACADDVIAGQEIADQGLNFIAKPFSIDSLATKIRQVLGKASAI
ncbi:MAG TPA: transporter substrate-binding domain-containing protein [Candidatus Rifleibacterium sp.]|nr:transporter substrate-binding domain-containing protein [Candidatus Rifleibacterium sp.]HPT44766.1 transporter substrate-binding domain-containing protein [Candidatus Rifleibacterium sp.]